MKRNIKLLIIPVILFSLASCGVEENKNEDILIVNNTCEGGYKIGEVDKTTLKLRGVVISDEVKTISSPMAGNIDYLNCEAGKEVYPDTLISKINPDFNNPNTINLSIQKGSLINQKTNLESVKTSTISSFNIQISSLDNQISSLEKQINLLKQNTTLTKESSNLSKNDLEKQIESLENTLFNLKDNLELVKKAKVEALEKIDISRKGLLTNIKNISKDNLLKIDEIFGITDDNRDLNDKYEAYLSAKNSSLRYEVEKEFRRLNLLETVNLNDKDISIFLGDLIALNDNTRNAIKESIANVYLTQVQIDSFYVLFLNYSNNLIEIKNNWDALENSKSSVITNYDTQLSSLVNQINTSETSLENLKTNKTDSINVGLDLQLSGLDSQLKTLESNLDNLKSQKSNLLTIKDTQILNLENQILQISQVIDSLNISLSTRTVYSEISGTVKEKLLSSGNKVGINTPICQIIPNTNSKKIKIFSSIELKKGDKLTFNFNGEDYEIQIKNVLIYKDPITQNYVYESNYLDKDFFKNGEILSLSFEKSLLVNSLNENEQISKDIKIPISYVKNKIDGNFVKVKSGSLVLDKKVILGDINGNFIEIKNGLEEINEVCR